MTKYLTSLMFGAALAVSAPAAAQQSVAVADLNKAVADVAAFKTAEGQIQTQYKAQIDAFNARRQTAATELQGLQRELQTLQNTPNTPPATLQAKVTAYRNREAALQRDLQPLAAPFQRPLAYAQEQVASKIEQAVRGAMTAKRVGILLQPQATQLALPGSDITADVTAQLNQLVKTVSITPPANWQPGQPAAGAPAAAAGATPPGR